ncbi:apolipoprotein N-acyltransferase [Albidovulum sediminicola]|uniref:Apolipoprotein N-acyltransferase n=1 Tax=Albidovulum sediminicola TaxID=2984331 RepID=A0ABT2YXM7_9RHOB|nr:apolipoprotein N-acyltransferase [Defluviimonas sp. WL0075]MCV2863585.1 apolipoprotein N-acyltransferase [Defluviimonas sp. WL0075]
MRIFRFLRRDSRPGWRALAGAVVLGVAMASGQAPFGLWWLSLGALGVLTGVVAAEARRAQRLWLGWAAGLGYFALALFWIVDPFLVEPEIFGWMAPFALILMCAGMALFWLFAAALAGLGHGRAGRVLGFALGLALSDLARGYVLTGFPWALIGHVWIDTPVAQAAAFVGPVGLTLMTTLLAAMPLLARGMRARLALAVVTAAALGGLWLAGEARLHRDIAGREPPVRVRLVQPDADQALKWQGDMWRVFLERQITLTSAPSTQPLDLVIWPETAVPYLLGETGDLFERMIAASGGVPIVTGIQRAEGTRYFNSLIAIDATAEVTALHDKSHLVPFGEYIPFGDLLVPFGIRAFAAQEGFGYTGGSKIRTLDLGRAGQVLPLICYEAIFPQDLNRAVGQADWVLQITNDGWFGDISGPYQHLAQTKLRAIEQGLPVVRVANTGVSAVIDAKGRVVGNLALNTQGVLDADVPPSLDRPLYARTGDLPAALLLCLGLGGLLLRRRFAD